MAKADSKLGQVECNHMSGINNRQLERGYNPIMIKNNGKLISKPTQMAMLFNSFFIEIVEKLQCNFNPRRNKHTTVNQKLSHSIFFTPTKDVEITAVIKGLKNKTSSELDGFSSCLTKKHHAYLIKPLTFLTNFSLNTGRFPENLKTSKIKPLFKNGYAYEIENYRQISLISSFSKILQKNSMYQTNKFF